MFALVKTLYVKTNPTFAKIHKCISTSEYENFSYGKDISSNIKKTEDYSK